MHSASEPNEALIDCAGALEAIRRFVAGDDVRSERARLRAHVSKCASCRSYYREFVETAARLSRARARPERERSDDELEERITARRVSMLSPVQQRRPTRLTKGLLVVLGLLACFALVRPDKASSRVRLQSLGGDVRHGLDAVAADAHEIAVQRGKACSTGADSRARLESGASSALFEPATAAIVEDEFSLRLHLLEGQLVIEGSAVIVTPLGVVELENAAGVVHANGKSLCVRAGDGVVRVTDAAGARLLAAGERIELPPTDAREHTR